jgi:tetrahydromethanopterin S-methyltransferase subunit G
MNVERTIQFLLKNQARMDARMDAKFAKADARFNKAEKRLDRLDRVVAQNNRIVTQLVRYGVSLRNDVRRIDKALAETDEKLNALIDIVDQSIRRNGR